MKRKTFFTLASSLIATAASIPFSAVLARPIIIPPHNHLQGIYGNNITQLASSGKDNNTVGNPGEPAIILERSRKVLERSINLLVTRNTQLENRIKNNSVVYGDFAQSIKSELESDSQELNGYVTAATLASSSDALSSIAKSISSYKAQQSSDLRKLVVLAHITQYEKSVLATALKRATLVGKKINSLKTEGKNTSGLESLLSQVNSELASAQQAINLVKDSVNSESIDIIMLSDIQQKLASAQDTVKNTYRLFTQIALLGSQLIKGNSSSTATSSPL